jgi:hypothetical protein
MATAKKAPAKKAAAKKAAGHTATGMKQAVPASRAARRMRLPMCPGTRPNRAQRCRTLAQGGHEEAQRRLRQSLPASPEDERVAKKYGALDWPFWSSARTKSDLSVGAFRTRQSIAATGA